MSVKKSLTVDTINLAENKKPGISTEKKTLYYTNFFSHMYEVLL